jgi:serine/threonine protein kinase
MEPQRWKQIDAIFAAALERDAAERPAFLDEACAGDAELRKEVESLLAHQVPESLLGGQAVNEATRLLELKGGEITGDRIGHYRIIRSLGAGGMGRVYLGLDEKLNRPVAIKLLSNYDASEKERARRFLLEAQAAAALNHPNIAHIYEIGEVQSTHFIAMEFVDGETLRQKLREERELKVLLKYLLQVAEGLGKAHAGGIVHRDLKPDNIMITRDGHAKILDFGLAKLLAHTKRQGGREEVRGASEMATALMPLELSTPGVAMGTVGYMSPEQAQAKSVDQRSDIFSFGCILYEIATGRKPFAGESVRDILDKIIKEPAPSISDLNPSASPELQRVIRKCLAKEPEKRYQTIRDTANDLEELIEELQGPSDMDRSVAPATITTSGRTSGTDGNVLGESTALVGREPTSSAEYIASGIRQHKLVAILAVVVLVASAVALGLYLHAQNTTVAIDSIAVLPFENKSTEADADYLAAGLAESLLYRLSQLPNLKVSPTSSVRRYQGNGSDPVKIGKELGVSAVLSGRIVQRGDNLTISIELVDVRYNKLLWGEQYDRKMSDLLATQRNISREIVEKLKLKVSGEQNALARHYTENNEAYQLYLKGRFYWTKRTPEALKKATDYFNQAIEKDPGFALAIAGLADCYLVPGNPESPNEKMPKAKAAAARALQLDETIAEAHTSMARVLATYDWDWAGAEKEYQRAIELDPRYPTAHIWYSGYLQVMGRTQEMTAERKRAQELDPVSLTNNFAIGLNLYFEHKYDQAIEQFQKTLELDPNFPPVPIFLGAAYEQKGALAEAVTAFQKGLPSLGMGERSLGMAGLGHAYAISGKKTEAQAVLNEMKGRYQTEYVTGYGIALIYAGLGEKDQAFAWLEAAYKERAFQMQFLKLEPRWDSLRSDPRFAELQRRVGLPN